MPSEKLNFTIKSLNAISAPPKGKRVYYRDTVVKGLTLDVTSSGSKTFYLYKFIDGKPERIYLGKFPDLSVENARKAATIHRASIAQGQNPQDEKRKIRDEMTFEQLFRNYLERHSKVNKKSWIYDEREVKKFLSQWFPRKISSIKKLEVQKIHESIRDQSGLYQANRILERVRGIYNKAIEWGWDGVNPAIGIKKFKEKSRDRFVLPSEMPFLIKSLSEEPNETAKDYLWMLLLTGVRRTNTLQMRWEQIMWEQGIWRIPDSKNGEPVIVPLVKEAIGILKRRKETSRSPWIFPSEADDTKHLINFKRAWKRTLQKATLYLWNADENFQNLFSDVDLLGVDYEAVNSLYKRVQSNALKNQVELPIGLMDIHIHDIRRTFGSYQAITGASLQIIGKSLGHKSPMSTQVYARLNVDPVRASIEKATEAMFDFSEFIPPIVPSK